MLNKFLAVGKNNLIYVHMYYAKILYLRKKFMLEIRGEIFSLSISVF